MDHKNLNILLIIQKSNIYLKKNFGKILNKFGLLIVV